jgi:hypothetical protein
VIMFYIMFRKVRFTYCNVLALYSGMYELHVIMFYIMFRKVRVTCDNVLYYVLEGTVCI